MGCPHSILVGLWLLRRPLRTALCDETGAPQHVKRLAKVGRRHLSERQPYIAAHLPLRHNDERWLPRVLASDVTGTSVVCLEIPGTVATQALMQLMHGNVMRTKLEATTTNSDSKLLWHLSFGANMNPKACANPQALCHHWLPNLLWYTSKPQSFRRLF